MTPSGGNENHTLRVARVLTEVAGELSGLVRRPKRIKSIGWAMREAWEEDRWEDVDRQLDEKKPPPVP